MPAIPPILPVAAPPSQGDRDRNRDQRIPNLFQRLVDRESGDRFEIHSVPKNPSEETELEQIDRIVNTEDSVAILALLGRLKQEQWHKVLSSACLWNHPKIARMLLERVGSRISRSNAAEVLTDASSGGNPDIVRMVLHYLKPRISSRAAEEALGNAMDEGRQRCACVLLEQLSDRIFIASAEDALDIASKKGYSRVVRKLLQHVPRISRQALIDAQRQASRHGCAGVERILRAHLERTRPD